MAATVKRKPKKGTTKRKGPRAAAKPSTNGVKTKSAGTGKFAPEQKPLDTMKDVDERIPELTDECQRYLGARDKRRSAKLDMEESGEKIRGLLKTHEVTNYVVNGEKFYEEPGAPAIKVQKVKQKG